MPKRFSYALAPLGLALLVPNAASAWCRTTTDQSLPSSASTCVTTGIPLAWTRRCQTFSVDTRAGGGLDLTTFRSVVAASFGTWNAVDCGMGKILDITAAPDVACDVAEYSSTNGNSNSIAFVSASTFSQRMYPGDAIAVTVVWHNTDTGQIYDADMMINDGMGPFANCGATCAFGETRFDLGNVVTHEAGHFLGLAHSVDVDSTMYYRAEIGETSKRSLAQDDLDGICAAYGTGTLPSECDPTPRHGFDANCTSEPSASKRGCGCSLEGSSAPAPRASWLAGMVLGLVALFRGSRRRSRES